MAHFPVTSSNLSAVHIGLFLQEHYGLSKDTTCQIIKAGVNHTYLITDGTDKFVFRVYSLGWRTYVEIAEEIALLNELHQQGIAVSYALPNNNQHFIQTLNAPEGDRYAVLFTYAKGEKLHLLSTTTHFEIGQLMARLHQVTHNRTIKRVHYTPDVLLVDPLQKIARFLPTDTDEMRFMHTAQQYLLKVFEEAAITHIRQGVVHLDIWFDNISVTANNEVTIFDFDFCGNGWLCLDIAYYVLQLHNIEKYEPADYQPKIDSFMKGYESITPISEEEKRLLPMLGVSIYFFYLGVQCQRYDNWSNAFLNENYLKRFINGLVKRYWEIYGLGVDA